MKKNIITASGTASNVVAKLELLKKIFPKGATLADIEKTMRYARITTATRKQINGD